MSEAQFAFASPIKVADVNLPQLHADLYGTLEAEALKREREHLIAVCDTVQADTATRIAMLKDCVPRLSIVVGYLRTSHGAKHCITLSLGEAGVKGEDATAFLRKIPFLHLSDIAMKVSSLEPLMSPLAAPAAGNAAGKSAGDEGEGDDPNAPGRSA